MKDYDGNELTIGNRVKKYGRDDLLFEIKDFEDNLVVCGNPPPPPPPPDVLAWPPDNARIRYIPTDLVKVSE